MSDTVRCCRCKEYKTKDLFGMDKGRHNGLTSYCKPCSSAYDKELYRKNAEYRKSTMRSYRERMKREVFDAYGRECKCCGETEELFLDIDHMDNNGADHRKEHNLSCGTQFYAWLVNNNFPSNFQTLCCNCNRGKYRNGGICPHKENNA